MDVKPRSHTMHGPWCVTNAIESSCIGEGLPFTEYYKDSENNVHKDIHHCIFCAVKNSEPKLCHYCSKHPRMGWMRFANPDIKKEMTGFTICQSCNDEKRAKYEAKGRVMNYCCCCGKHGSQFIRERNKHYCSQQCQKAPKCGKCQRSKLGMARCSLCKQVHYCSKECQQEDWRQHKLAFH